MASKLKRRLDRLESPEGGGGVFVVDHYKGLTKEEAMLLRFGADGPPPGATIIHLHGGLPRRPTPESFEVYHLAEKRGMPEFEATLLRLSAHRGCYFD